jgi:acetylornithine/N-succinyldiaminopimelate aminotransferase
MATEKAAQGMTAGSHGSTFGGNPLAMAVANAVMDVMLEPGFLEHVQETATLLHRRLEGLVAAHPKVFTEVRGKGLLVGLKCAVPNGDVVTKLREAGLLAVAAGENVLRLLPPLIIGKAEVEEAVAILDGVAKAWTH